MAATSSLLPLLLLPGGGAERRSWRKRRTMVRQMRTRKMYAVTRDVVVRMSRVLVLVQVVVVVVVVVVLCRDAPGLKMLAVVGAVGAADGGGGPERGWLG
jgi:hypothetical protein